MGGRFQKPPQVQTQEPRSHPGLEQRCAGSEVCRIRGDPAFASCPSAVLLSSPTLHSDDSTGCHSNVIPLLAAAARDLSRSPREVAGMLRSFPSPGFPSLWHSSVQRYGQPGWGW